MPIKPTIFFSFFLLLAACAIDAPRPRIDDIRFTDKTPFRLNVARIDIVDDYRAPKRLPNVDHTFPIKPRQAARNWARDRLRAVGRTGRAVVTIVEASVIEKKLKRERGVTGLFKIEQSERYTGHVILRIELSTGDGRGRAQVTGKSRREQTVPEDITLNERYVFFNEFTQAMLSDLDRELSAKIRQHFVGYLR